MARLGLRQFLRSSYDPGDKTMARPIIAWLVAGTLLLGSCGFTSITAASSDNYYENDRDSVSLRIQQDEAGGKLAVPLPPPPGARAYVRRSNYSAPASYPEKAPNVDSATGSRALNAARKLSRDKKKKNRDHSSLEVSTRTLIDDYLGILGKHMLLIIDIAAKEIDRGIKNIAANVEKHEDGQINVSAETKMGKSVGTMARKYLKQFFRDRWVGVLAHMAQEATDRMIIGSEIFFAKTDIPKIYQ